VNKKELLELQFLLARHGIVDAYNIMNMDYLKVVALNNRVIQYESEGK